MKNKSTSNPIEELRIALGYRLVNIHDFLEESGVIGVKLTLVARHPTNSEMFIILSNDDDHASVANLLNADSEDE